MKTSKKKGNLSGDTKPIRREVDLNVSQHNGKPMRKVIATIGEFTFLDEVNVSNATSRERFIKRLATESQLPIDELRHVSKQLIDAAAEADAKAEEQANAEQTPEVTGEDVLQSEEAILAATPDDIKNEAVDFLKSPNLFEKLGEHFDVLGIIGEFLLAATIYLIGTSRKLDRPLGGCVKSPSSSGKSHVTETVASMFPPEKLTIATDMSPNSLYYMPAGNLKNSFVVKGERQHVVARDEGAEANAGLALRELLSRGRLDKYIPIHTDDGGFVTTHIEQEGPIAYVETTTQQNIFEEDATRMLSLATDESAEQTGKINKQQAAEAAGKCATAEEKARIVEVHRTAQRMLRPLHVRIPFAELLEVPPTKVISRRAFPQLLGCIKAVALLRQFQKNEKDGRIVATVKDYEFAHSVMQPILKRAFSPVSERAMRLFDAIRSHHPNPVPGAPFTRADAQKWGGFGATETANRLNSLLDVGLIELESPAKQGKKNVYRLGEATSSHKTMSLAGLLTPAQLKEAWTKKKTQKAAPEKGVI